MANAFYNPSGAPVTSSFGASASIRAEFSAIAAGFDKLPSSLTANKAVVVNAGATGLTISTGTLTLNGNLSVATGKTVTLSNTLTFTGTDGSSVNFGTGGTVVFGVSGTANEIGVSTVSGTATVSLPTSLTFTGKTVTGGTFASPTFSGTVAGAHSYSGAITSSSTIAATSFNATTSTYQLNGNYALVQIGNYTFHYTSNGVAYVQAGNATDQQTYHNNDGHVFRNAAQSSTYASIVATGTTLTGANASQLAVGRQGATNPVLQVDASTASVVTGIKVTGAAAAGGVAVVATSSGTNENISLNGKGTGEVQIGSISSGYVKIGAGSGVGVLIGNVATNAGNLTNGVPTIVGVLSSYSGSVGGLSLNAWVTVAAIPAGTMWDVATFASVGAAGYSCAGTCVNDSGSGAMAAVQTGNSFELQMSGGNLQCRQISSGGTLTCYFTLIRRW